MRVLVTGFGPFLEFQENPSERVARQLEGLRIGALEFTALAPLPVEYEVAAALTLAEARRVDASTIVAIGLAGSDPVVRLEREAKNAVASGAPDASGSARRGQLARLHGPPSYQTALPVDAWAMAMTDRGVACRISEDCGGYVCNDLYFRLLDAVSGGRGPRLAGFVHVPPDVLVQQPRFGYLLATSLEAALRSDTLLDLSERRGEET